MTLPFRRFWYGLDLHLQNVKIGIIQEPTQYSYMQNE